MRHAKADETFEVIVRYRPVAQQPKEKEQEVGDVNRRKNSLKGYGVEMVLKRTDYLAVDDRDTGVVESESVLTEVAGEREGTELDKMIDRQQEVFQVHQGSDNVTGADGYLGVIGHGSWDELVSKPLKLGEIAGRSKSHFLNQNFHELTTST